MSGLRVRRLALTTVAAGLVVAAEALATLNAAAPHPYHASHYPRAARRRASKQSGGEPQPSERSTAPRAPWIAAVRFVRDYAAWEAGRLARLHSHDATERVIALLGHAGRHGLGAVDHLTHSVRIGVAGSRGYIATSAVGNFLIGRQGSRWLVVSLPGD